MQPMMLRAHGALIAALAVVACSSDATSPRGPLTIRIAPASQGIQVAAPGTAVAIAPAVIVERDGVPQANILVDFVVTSGGGSVIAAEAPTDANGIATAVGWTLGGTETANELQASIGGGTALVFASYAVNLPTGADEYDLIGSNGAPLPSGPVYSPYLEVAGRLILGSDSTYLAKIIEYDDLRRTWSVGGYRGNYTRNGVALTFTDYAGADIATGAIQMDLLAIHSEFGASFDTAPSVNDDLYRHVGQ